MPRRSILSAAKRASLLALPDKDGMTWNHMKQIAAPQPESEKTEINYGVDISTLIEMIEAGEICFIQK